MSAAVSIYIYDHTPSGQSRLYKHRKFSVHGTNLAVSIYIYDHTPSGQSRLYKHRKFSVHGTNLVPYIVFQNIPGYDVLLLYTMDRF